MKHACPTGFESPVHVIRDFVRSPLLSSEGNRKEVGFDQLRTGREILYAYGGIEHYGEPSGGSPYASWQSSVAPDYGKFAQSVILRSNLYLITSEVLGVPYRADSLRWPLCWKALSGRRETLPADSQMIRLAEEQERKRIQTMSDFLGTDRIFIKGPLFLGYVLSENKSPSDIVRAALEIRDSSEARRFREYAAQLQKDIADEELSEVLEGIRQYSAFLTKKYGKHENEVITALFSAVVRQNSVRL